MEIINSNLLQCQVQCTSMDGFIKESNVGDLNGRPYSGTCVGMYSATGYMLHV